MEPFEIEARRSRYGAANLHPGRGSGSAASACADQVKEALAAGDQRGASLSQNRKLRTNRFIFRWLRTPSDCYCPRSLHPWGNARSEECASSVARLSRMLDNSRRV